MLAGLNFTRGDRLLVFAPHPDDETLATGDAIVAATAAGAAVRVVFATDGDNNPWPQRWLEKRWTIGADDKARWGARRRCEALAALAILGVDAVDAAVFLGWPDQGLTEKLMVDTDAVTRIGEEIERFAPTHVCMPMLVDRHPDHSALRILCDLALLRSKRSCVKLGYVVHAAPQTTFRGDVEVVTGQNGKRAALDAHRSQMALGRKRLREVAARPERFEIAASTAGSIGRASTLRLRAVNRSARHGNHALLIVLATRNGDVRLRVPVRAGQTGTVTHANDVSTEWNGDDLLVGLPRQDAALLACYAKFDRAYPRLVVFDRELWRADDVLLAKARSAAFRGAIADTA